MGVSSSGVASSKGGVSIREVAKSIWLLEYECAHQVFPCFRSCCTESQQILPDHAIHTFFPTLIMLSARGHCQDLLHFSRCCRKTVCCTFLLRKLRSWRVSDIVQYKGRLCFRQYIKIKRKRYGLKLFSACPSAPCARGYTWHFCLYTPAVYAEMLQDPDLAVLSESIPVFLMKSLLYQGQHIVLDNWYSSLDLAEYLLNNNTLNTGTIRTNRGVRDIVRQAQL